MARKKNHLHSARRKGMLCGNLFRQVKFNHTVDYYTQVIQCAYQRLNNYMYLIDA